MTTTKRTRKPAAIRSEEAAPYSVTVTTMTEDQILARAQEIAEARMRNPDVFINPAQTRFYLIAMLRPLQHEIFGALFVDSQHRLIAPPATLATGTIDGAAIYPREVVKAALKVNAAAIIFYHNHPSGMPEPSMADRQITRRLTDALALVDIRVLDHIVVGAAESVSFAERGLL